MNNSAIKNKTGDLSACSTYRITQEQERLWLEWKLKPSGHAYNVNLQSRITGSLNREKLFAAIAASVEYFDTFRSYFEETPDGDRQNIIASLGDVVDFHDLSDHGLSLEACETKAQVILQRALQKPFNLKAPPLIRYTLVQCAPDLHYFSFVAPHIFCDHGSANTILQFVSQAYSTDPQLCMKQFAPANEGTVADYFNYTADYYSAEEKQAARQYWLNATRNIQPKVHFKHFQPPSINSDLGARRYFQFDAQQMQAIKTLARQHRTTPFSVLLAAFDTLLYRYFGQTDITVAYPVNMRPSHLRRLPHFFTNTLPLRTQLNGQMLFGDLIDTITRQRKNDRPYQALSYGDIVKAIRKNGVNYKDAKLNVTFAQTHFGLESFDFAGCKTTQVPPIYAEVASDLTLVYDVSTPPYLCAFEYKLDIFDEETIAAMAQHFVQLLDSVCTNSQQPLDAIALISQHNTHQIMTREAIASVCFDENLAHQAFERQSHVTPAATALLTTSGESITYQTLEQKANGLAHMLQSQGVKPNDKVAIIQPRSIEQILSIFAVLKVGGVYVPINPEQPQERTHAMLSQCDCSLVLTHIDTPSMSYGDLPYITVSHSTLPYMERISVERSASDIAYILFTSGSTNVPNGVQVSHCNIAVRMGWYNKTLNIKLHETVLSRINIWFDPSVYEILGTLSSGARLVIADENEIRDTQKFIALLNAYHVNITNTVPSQLANMLQHLSTEKLADLRCVISGGEALQPKLKDQFRTVLPHTRLLNMYGPTECTIMATCEDCSESSYAGDKISIGKAINHTEVHIYTPQMQIQPNGAEGEICISGPGVTQGYFNNSELNAERFIAHPYVPHVKLYRTGDMGYKASDGEVFFLGRRDHQIKLRGNRIELPEIERAMYRLFDFETVAVLLKKSEAKLIAYISGTTSYTVQHICQQLKTVLPTYMIPAEYIPLDSFPLTSNGKIDRAALQHIDADALPQQATDYGLTPLEKRLTQLWAQTLQILPESINPEVTFFDLGGDSFEVVNLAAQMEQNLECALPAEMIFEYPTIRQLAGKLEDAQSQIVTSENATANSRRAAMQQFKTRKKEELQ